MSTSSRRSLYLPLTLIFLILCSCSSAIKRDSLACRISLQNLQGDSAGIDLEKSKYSMLHFWSTWCVACEHELRMLENFKKHIRPGNLQIISIAIDSTLEDVRRIMNKNSLSGDFYIDSEQTTKDYFEITGIPQTIMLNHKGERIRFLAPETGLSSFSANGPQTWDRPDVIEYFSRRFR